MPTTWGARIPGRSLGCLYSAQVAQGTGVTPATTTGAQFRVTSEGGGVAIQAIGSKSPILMKPGMSQVPFELTIPNVQGYTFIDAAVERVGGQVPFITLGFGAKFDGTGTVTEWGWQVQDCKVASGSFGLRAGGPLTANVRGTGGLITELSNFDPANDTTNYPHMAYEAVLTRAGAAFEVIEWREEFDHNVSVDWVVHGATVASFKRGWTYQTEGDEIIRGSFTLLQKSGVDLQTSTVGTFASVLTLTSFQAAANKIIFTYAGMVFPEEAFEGAPDGATFTVPYVATTRTITNS